MKIFPKWCLYLTFLLFSCGVYKYTQAQKTPLWERAHLGFGAGTTTLGGEGSFKYKSYPALETFLDVELTKKIHFKSKFLYTNVGGESKGGLRYLPKQYTGEDLGKIVNASDYPGNTLPYQFKTQIFELSFIPQYDFFDVTQGKRFTPYIFGGVGIFHYNRSFIFPNGETEPGGIYLPAGQTSDAQGVAKSSNLLNVPVGIGVKYAVTRFLGVYGEFSRRILFTDYIDGYGSSDLYQNNFNDYYYPIMVGVYFRLGGFETSLFRKSTKEHSYKEPKEKRRNVSRKGCPPVYL